MAMPFKDAAMHLNSVHTIFMVVLFFPNISKICGFELGPMLSALAHFNEGKLENTVLWIATQYFLTQRLSVCLVYCVNIWFRNHFEALNQGHEYNNLTAFATLGNKKSFFLGISLHYKETRAFTHLQHKV